MFKTLKSINIALTILILLIFSIVNVLSAYNSLKSSKNLELKNCESKVLNMVDNINNDVVYLQDKVKQLAFLGKIFVLTGLKSQKVLDYKLNEFFKHKSLSIGGGIWFEPYVIKSDKDKFFSFIFHKNNKLVRDNARYEYINTTWYKDLKNTLEPQKNVWTLPYRDNEGSEELMITVGSEIYDSSNKLIGLATVDWELTEIANTIAKFNITPNTITIFADRKNDFIISTNKSTENTDLFGESLNVITWYSNALKTGDKVKIKNQKFIVFIRPLSNDMVIIVAVPEWELFGACYKHFYLTLIVLFFVCICTVFVTYIYFRELIEKPVKHIAKLAKRIGEGNLDLQIQTKYAEEFSILAKVLNKTKDDLKMFMKNREITVVKEELLRRDLDIAREIQSSVLPNMFPAYPNHKEFRVYAKMRPAQEVGGDFFDFFFINDTHFAYLVADVSEKGIPAALFMMTIKATIKDIAKTEVLPEVLMAKLNHKIYEANSQGYFVTLFIAITDITNGKTVYVNAGHNQPLVRRAGGEFEYLTTRSNFVVGLRDKIKYKACETQVNPGDIIVMYTDGLTEAMNVNNELYGEDRFRTAIINSYNNNNNNNDNNNFHSNYERLVKTLEDIKMDVRLFTGEAEQSDDRTLLIFEYVANTSDCGSEILTVPANVEQLEVIKNWVDDICVREFVDTKHLVTLKIIIEEIFVNIVDHSYVESNNGTIQLDLSVGKEELELKFTDRGVPFNPLALKPANFSATAEERMSGGFGVALIKDMADELTYNFIDDYNVLTVKLNLNK